jgi:hypothetical protein
MFITPIKGGLILTVAVAVSRIAVSIAVVVIVPILVLVIVPWTTRRAGGSIWVLLQNIGARDDIV